MFERRWAINILIDFIEVDENSNKGKARNKEYSKVSTGDCLINIQSPLTVTHGVLLTFTRKFAIKLYNISILVSKARSFVFCSRINFKIKSYLVWFH